jgi:hypothetical protein
MPGWSKQEVPKATPAKRGDIEIKHNIYDLVGMNLLRVFEEGNITKKQTIDMLKQLTLEASVDLGKGYGVDLGYNVPLRHRGGQHRIRFTKDLP